MPTSRLLLLLLFGALLESCGTRLEACSSVARNVNADVDAAAPLLDCIRQAAPGDRIELPPGVYLLKTPIVITKSVTISTAGLAPGARGCGDLAAGACATLRLNPVHSSKRPGAMPIEIIADHVRISHLVIEGVGLTPRQRASCREQDRRPLGGGLRVSASAFLLRKSVLRNFACYTALEITAGSRAPRIEDNVIGPNGDHSPGEIWSDGVTIHDSNAAVVRRNLFIDNTDVQLILGGCKSCRIEDNRFRHSLPFTSASFAELMLHSWPTTSGNYSGTVVRSNSIDCGPERRCGFGIMVGAAPWYAGRMRGGEISGNAVSNAMVAINVDGLTGPVTVRNNEVRDSGGKFGSKCGFLQWPAVNIAPESRPLVSGDPSDAAEGSISSAGCLLNREPHDSGR